MFNLVRAEAVLGGKPLGKEYMRTYIWSGDDAIAECVAEVFKLCKDEFDVHGPDFSISVTFPVDPTP